jgi:putative transcriptional regulator
MVGGAIYRGVEIPVKSKLKILRAERNLSQTALGELVGVSRQTINAIERGKYNPSLPLAFDLADVFNLKIEEIFIRTQSKS